MGFETLEDEIIEMLNQKSPGEVETKEVIEQMKQVHQKTPYSQIKVAILTLIDNDKVELTHNLCLKLRDFTPQQIQKATRKETKNGKSIKSN